MPPRILRQRLSRIEVACIYRWRRCPPPTCRDRLRLAGGFDVCQPGRQAQPYVGFSENGFLRGLQGAGLMIDVEVIRALPRSVDDVGLKLTRAERAKDAAAQSPDPSVTIRARLRCPESNRS